MKDYSLNSKLKEVFITNYEIKDGSIIINFADDSNWIMPHTEEHELVVLDAMEQQVELANSQLNTINKSIKNILFTYGFIASSIVICSLIMTIGLAIVLPYISIVSTVVLTLNSISFIKLVSKKQEIEKMNLFLKEKTYLNEELSKAKNVNICDGISKKAEMVIEASPTNKARIIDINNLDNFTLKDLKKLKRNIDKHKEFNFFSDMNVPKIDDNGFVKFIQNNK